MKRFFKIAGILIGFAVFSIVLLIIYYLLSTPSAEWLIKKAMNQTYSWEILDRNYERIYVEKYSNYTKLDDISPLLIQALVRFEDQSFYDSPGWNPIANLRRMMELNFKAGGSTIDMQTVRNITDYREHTLDRKLREIALALKLNSILNKKEILELYFNTSAFGSVTGIGRAAEYYFNTKPDNLTIEQAVYLVALLPGIRSVDERFEAYQNKLLQEKIILERLNKPLRFSFSEKIKFSGVFADRVIDNTWSIISNKESEVKPFDPLIITTMLDKSINERIGLLIEKTTDSLKALGYDYNISFMMTNANNEVISYVVRGRNRIGDLDDLQSDASLPASRFKVIVYALMINKLLEIDPSTTSSQLENIHLPIIYKYPNSQKVVRDNSTGSEFTSLRNAISKSLNAPALFAGNEIINLDMIVRYCKMFGVSLNSYPSLPLGSQGISESNLLNMYYSILNNGILSSPAFIKKIKNFKNDFIIYSKDKTPEIRVLNEDVSHMMKLLMESTLEGTSKDLLKSKLIKEYYKKGLKIYNKTGTSQNGKRQFGCSGLIEWQKIKYFYTLKVESKKTSKILSSDIAVPLLRKIFSVVLEQSL